VIKNADKFFMPSQLKHDHILLINICRRKLHRPLLC